MESESLPDDEIRILELFKNRVATGTDVKLLQYESFAKDRCFNTIDLAEILKVKLPVIMINIEKDIDRYKSCIEELKKIKTTNWIHLKATYWKDTTFISDLNFILKFLDKSPVTSNKFSEISDPDILIQDGPLACYCSHVRALIYGYYNFDSHFAIVEDDILIANTEKIEKYIKQVPYDWDIITLNAHPINQVYSSEIYKFTNTFHSTHFYIINRRCLETIFKGVYPITDQIDILISQLHNKLNIYNIIETVYQKNFSTNTQNNLYVIYNSPNYSSVRGYIKELEEELLKYINVKIKNNNNIFIRNQIMDDVIWNYIIHNNLSKKKNTYIKSSLPLFNVLYIIIHCCVKGINVNTVTSKLIEDIDYIIDCFGLHCQDASIGSLKAIAYGSTANVFRAGNFIYKVYNDRLRWSCVGHDNINSIFNKEAMLLKLVYPSVIVQGKMMIIDYLGKSLYESFNLPSDWEDQIKGIFKKFNELGIYYPEFNLKNIVVLDNKISFIDFGLASFSEIPNKCSVFIDLLGQLDTKFKNEFNFIFYTTFMNNLRLSGNECVF